jgi:hypothetical protein
MAVIRISRHLPAVFALGHEIAFALHDTLAGYVAYGHRHGLFRITVPVATDGTSDPPEVGEQAFAWLERTGRSKELGEVLFRMLVAGLLGDACHFIYEALRCAEKGKLTVAFALLRKPLKESLYYLEYLLADPETFLNTFYNESIDNLKLPGISYRERAIDIIARAAKQTVHPDMYDAEFLYDTRFDKAAPYGLELYWTRALHLVTTRPPINTEPQNLNFVFSNSDDLLSQWSRFYTLVPFLLYYMADVSTSLMFHLVDEVPTEWMESIWHRRIGLMLMAGETTGYPGRSREAGKARRRFPSLSLVCPRCGTPIIAGRERLLRLFHGARIRCPNCKRVFGLPALAAA